MVRNSGISVKKRLNPLNKFKGSFQQLPPPHLVPSRESPPLLCYILPRYYLAYSLYSRILV